MGCWPLSLWSHTSPSQQQREGRKAGGRRSLSAKLVRGQAQKSGSGLARTVGGCCARAPKELVPAWPSLRVSGAAEELEPAQHLQGGCPTTPSSRGSVWSPSRNGGTDLFGSPCTRVLHSSSPNGRKAATCFCAPLRHTSGNPRLRASQRYEVASPEPRGGPRRVLCYESPSFSFKNYQPDTERKCF